MVAACTSDFMDVNNECANKHIVTFVYPVSKCTRFKIKYRERERKKTESASYVTYFTVINRL